MSPDSPLHFAKKFARFKSELSEISSSDRLILKWLSFWPEVSPNLENRSYKSYIEEYAGIAESIIQPKSLKDLLPDELKELTDAVGRLNRAVSDKLRTQIDKVAYRRAELVFYLGEVDTALAVLEENDNTTYAIEVDYSPGQDEYSLFEQVLNTAEDKYPKLYQKLKDIKDDWDAAREGVYFDRINCLFVEKDEKGREARGRLRTLTGSVEIANKRSAEDHVSFNNEIKSPDDPFVGVAYDSLEASRSLLARQGLKRFANRNLHANLQIIDSDQKFTGNSIGAAMAVLAYIQIIKPEIRRELRYISGLMALTGGIDQNGEITSVNDDTIKCKIESAFYSAVKYVVVPKDNITTARSVRDSLQKKHPHRNLVLLAVSHLNEVLCNLNLIREEKVCIGDFLAQKTVRYARLTKVQVPLLLVLIYALISILYPRAWILFDDNPDHLEFFRNGFTVLNKNDHPLWSKEFECDSLTRKYDCAIHDMDKDNKNEVYFLMDAPYHIHCSDDSYLYAFDNQGNQLFKKSCLLDDELGVSQADSLKFDRRSIEVRNYKTSFILETIVCRSGYGAYIKYWDKQGNLIGWFVNNGFAGLHQNNTATMDDSVFVYLSYNHDIDRVCSFGLDPVKSQGFSPGYRHDYAREWNSQVLFYIGLPATYMSGADYNGFVNGIRMEQDDFSVSVIQARGTEWKIIYLINNNFRVTEVTSTDIFIKQFDEDRIERKHDFEDYKDLFQELHDSVMYWTDSGWVTERQLRLTEK